VIESDKLMQKIFDKLQAEKYNVTNQNQDLFIELPMFCSVTAHIENNQLNIKSRFGKLDRAYAMPLTFIIVILLVVLSFKSSSGLFILIFGTGAIVWDLIRWRKLNA
jgi:hypothetical protein